MRIYIQGKRHGDLSNYIKIVEDGLQYAGVIPNDKKIIRYGEGTGIYYIDNKEQERVEIEIEEVS
jgi:Holliday junction resolvase RusA-like endonuclease